MEFAQDESSILSTSNAGYTEAIRPALVPDFVSRDEDKPIRFAEEHECKRWDECGPYCFRVSCVGGGNLQNNRHGRVDYLPSLEACSNNTAFV